MTRIPIIERAHMDADQARVFEWATEAGGVTGGPYYAYIRLPKLFEASQNVRFCLHEGPLSPRERQVVNMVVARHWDAQYPWCAQVRQGLAVGLSQEIVDAINARQAPPLSDPREMVCHDVALELLANKHLSAETYRRAEDTLGLADLVALAATIGSFSMTCLTANTFEVDPPANAPTPLAP